MASALNSERVPVVSPVEPASTPRLLGRYEVLHPIATGGMAQLHLARMRGIEGFERLVVLKQLRPELTDSPDVVSMFLDEARLLAGIAHSNVVHLYDIGTLPDGGYFQAMEFLHGQTVRKIIRRARERGEKGIPLEQAIYIVNAILTGLHYVHEHRGPDGAPLHIVHRDVAPDNVIVTYDGEVKLLDFGIAKADSQTTTTQVGVLKGKVRYMSPEQCRGEPIDRRSDIFSVGILLWTLTTGRRLYGGGVNDLNTLFEIVERAAPPPSLFRAEYPPELERIVMRALERDKEHRFQTAREMQLELEVFAREHKMSLSAASMASFMEGHFADELSAWREAQQQGKELAAHVVEQLDEAPPSTVGRETSHPSGPSHRSYPSTSKVVRVSVAGWRRRPLLTASAVAVAAFTIVVVGLLLIFGGKRQASMSPPSGSAVAVTAVTTATTVAPPATPSLSPSADTQAAISPTTAASDLHASKSPSSRAAAPQAIHVARPPPSTKPEPTDSAAAAPPPTATPTAWDKDSPLPPP